ncbi:Aldo/keto reductase [Cristinia sonorae]|uniref:Aldo/keto reductase n=1 Tax=Cristinia sonorae TaxID=1940300 RepID=A0A8K0UWL5_9AGAR|nr:Aldo/keto reductase [Cristinia sonorae]
MVVPLDSPQPVFPIPPLSEIPDTAEDHPEDGPFIVRQPTQESLGDLQPSLVFGAAAFSNQYNTTEYLTSDVPLRTVRAALRYGITAFDTSAYYGPSEIVLGTALKTLEPEFPRSSYRLMTKCGRYGLNKEDFDYSPATIRASVNRSLFRLNTSYLDAVYLHDIEFVSEQVQPRDKGNHLLALGSESEAYGLGKGDEAKIHGPGDQIILDAVAELREMKKEGLIKHIGITGYPLHTLLRIAILVLHTAPFEPLDILLSYSHLHIQNDTFLDFVPQLRDRARISQFMAASPLNMGLLTPSPPSWHPAPDNLKDLVRKAGALCTEQGWEGGLPNVALGYAYRKSSEAGLPMVVGLSQLNEVHETVKVWREILAQSAEEAVKREALETKVKSLFGDLVGFSWASG